MALENQKIIDIHTHLFNLKYLPIRGVLQAHGVPRVFARAIEVILIGLTKSSNLSSGSSRKLFSSEEGIGEFPERLMHQMSDDELIQGISGLVEKEMFNNRTVRKALVKMEELEHKEKEGVRFIPFKQQYKAVREDPDLERAFRQEKIGSFLDKILSGFHYLRWFVFMLRSEENIYNELLKDYREIDTFVFHMMDADKFFKGRSKFSIGKKIAEMNALKNLSDGKLIGFVAFNPKRGGIFTNGLKIVKGAIKKYGFSGIKFYPPLGYRATSNTDRTIEKRINGLFEYCISEDIPVFTHCTPGGFESDPGVSGKNSDPKYWEALLLKNKFDKLRLCLGHAGGVEGWFAASESEFNDSYAKKVYDLCTTYENVYCEVGFLSDIHDPDKLNNYIKRLEHLLQNDSGKYPFKEKIMYGSDWHILFNHGIETDYHKKYMEIFSSNTLMQYRDLFFYENAARYLKL